MQFGWLSILLILFYITAVGVTIAQVIIVRELYFDFEYTNQVESDLYEVSKMVPRTLPIVILVLTFLTGIINGCMYAGFIEKNTLTAFISLCLALPSYFLQLVLLGLFSVLTSFIFANDVQWANMCLTQAPASACSEPLKNQYAVMGIAYAVYACQTVYFSLLLGYFLCSSKSIAGGAVSGSATFH